MARPSHPEAESDAPPSDDRSPVRGARRARAVWVVAACAGLFGATEYAVAALMRHHPYTVTMPVSLLIMVAVALGLAAVGAVVRVYNHWVDPVGRLREVIDRVRAGDATVGELADSEGELAVAAGGLAALVPPLHDLLRDLREARAEVARLNAEMRQKVAQRTDALERRLGSMRAQAERDPLTGLLNRRVLEPCAEEMVRRAQAERLPACAVMIDLDDFKMLNDTLGHAAGDELLKSVGQLIRSSVRQNDLAFRCGGDEFVLLLPDTGRIEAERMAKRMVELVDALTKPLSVPRKPRLCAGLASLSDCGAGATAKDLLDTADRHLYAVKNARKAALKATAARRSA